ncbi:MAG: RluA family pseudouridine synthase [Gammaproteobacteria bacterium]|nr:RluA family pseudouridine synthase [Gammaproteobacteria bacterium]
MYRKLLKDLPKSSLEQDRRAGSRVRFIDIEADDEGQRIDNFLIRLLKDVPKSRVYRLLRKGEVRINGGRVKPVYRLRTGDRLRLPPVHQGAPPVRSPAAAGPGRWLEQRIVFEDRQLLIIDKIAGMAVHGGSGISHGVIETLRAARGDLAHLELVHRLDKETSGCLMLTKRRSLLRELHAMLRDGAIEKRYLALVAGDWQRGRIAVDEALVTHERRGGERTARVDAAGKRAISRFRPVQGFPAATLMDVTLETGRMHQIRAHAAHVGHPVAGDDRYGDREFNASMRKLGLRRMFLHAHSLAFDYPGTGEALHVSAPLPDELKSVLATL